MKTGTQKYRNFSIGEEIILKTDVFWLKHKYPKGTKARILIFVKKFTDGQYPQYNLYVKTDEDEYVDGGYFECETKQASKICITLL